MAMRFSSDLETNRINNGGVFEFVNAIFGKTMHAKRVQSLANAALGLLHAEELILHKIGAGLAQAMGSVIFSIVVAWSRTDLLYTKHNISLKK